MANQLKYTSEGGRYWQVDSTATGANALLVSDASEETVGTVCLQVVPAGGGITFQPKLTLVRSGLTGANGADVVYYNANSETGITGTSTAAGLYYIPCDGAKAYVEITAAPGTAAIYFWKVKG